MKVILYSGQEIFQTYPNIENVRVSENSIFWEKDGVLAGIQGINCDSIVLEDDDEFTTETILRGKREDKLSELNNACSSTILGRFPFERDGATYYFSCDSEAQANFEKADRNFEKGRLTELKWTAYDMDGKVVRLLFTKDTFDPLYVQHLNHIQGNISKFRDVLSPKIESAASVEELEAIQW